MTGRKSKEFLRENRHPAHQAAKALLVKALPVDPMPDVLYGLQLMLWGLDNLDLDGRARDALLPEVVDLMEVPPARAHKYLATANQEHDAILDPRALKGLSLEEAAWLALSNLLDRMGARDIEPVQQPQNLAI